VLPNPLSVLSCPLRAPCVPGGVLGAPVARRLSRVVCRASPFAVSAATWPLMTSFLATWMSGQRRAAKAQEEEEEEEEARGRRDAATGEEAEDEEWEEVEGRRGAV